jgi:tRNA 2-thiouridine synthesizing protein A
MSEANGTAAGRNPDCRLDITAYICPMTFVKTKLQLEEMEAGELLALKIRKGESYNNVTRSVRDEGHAIVGEAPVSEEVVELFIEKGKD